MTEDTPSGSFEDVKAIAADRHRMPRAVIAEILDLEAMFEGRTTEAEALDLEDRVAAIAASFGLCTPTATRG